MPPTSTPIIPQQGGDHEKLLQQLLDSKAQDLDWKAGRAWSMVYYVDDAHQRLIETAYQTFLSENYLNPFVFNSLKNMEREVLQMITALLHGDDQTTGTLTSGGTESILLAVYTYREWARQRGPNQRRDEIIAPNTVHPAFAKAAHWLGLKMIHTPVNEDLQAIPSAVAQAIGPRTLLLVASAPSYPHGVLDPLAAIGALAQKHNLPFHVDACIGGLFLPWLEQLGHPIPPFDFRLPGVTSLATDLHKFGYGAKGASVLLYRNMSFLRHQFFVATEWPGGIYVSPTLLGSRSGGPIAAAWTALQALGQEGYRRISAEIMAGVSQLRAGMEALPDLVVLGKPAMNILAFQTRHHQPDIFVVADQLEARGWMVDRQQKPNCIHLTVMKHHIPVINTYLADLAAALAYAKANPRETTQGNAALYGLMARIPLRGMVKTNVRKIFEQLYTYGNLPAAAATDAEEAVTNTLAPAPRWMGWLNRFLQWWTRR